MKKIQFIEMIKINIGILFLFMVFLANVSGQTNKNKLNCDDIISYSPVNENYTPIKLVRITIHILQRTDSVDCFVEGETSRNWIRNKIILHLNGVLENLEKMRLKSSSIYIRDSRVRFVPDTILFHSDDFSWDMKCGKYYTSDCKITESLGDSLYSKYVIRNQEVLNKTNSIHIFCGENQTGKGMASGIGDKKWVMVTGFYHYYKTENFWMPANLLRHELGHSLGLIHTWNSDDYCDDTPENPGCWNGDGCSNNVMDYNANQSALTECQLSRIHYFLSGKAGNIKDALIKDYCESDGSEIVISEGDSVEWKSEKYLKGNIHIFNQSVLVIRCKVSLPEKAVIVIEKGGKLIIDGGVVMNDCGLKWKGLKVKGNRNQRKNPEKFGILQLLNGGTLQNIE